MRMISISCLALLALVLDGRIQVPRRPQGLAGHNAIQRSMTGFDLESPVAPGAIHRLAAHNIPAHLLDLEEQFFKAVRMVLNDACRDST
ncbi:hypothetical protein E2C01_068305 [Portunus trituberculatus]|uniref:Uncharacterized protein n=1 Tax=Portunus trituberculatus TaxID=210409 RepID=A0A5B7HVF9_PORTR|nr:hypothetical protein [Portunus trituberculatus]